MQLVLKRPQPKQLEFELARARHICFGGARGGGKSWVVDDKSIKLALRYPGLKILMLRRTLPELEENHIIPLLGILSGIAKYNTQKHVFTFPNKSRIKLGYCEQEKHVYRYQGQEYDVIFLEEATHFTETQMTFLTTCNRSKRDDFSPRMYYTCNPGGVGHMWVKRLFIDRIYQGEEVPEDYYFIQATIKDNPALFKHDKTYVKTLMNLPEDLRRAHMDGDWDVLSGQYFSEWRRELHAIDPIDIKENWIKYRAIDYGLDGAACIWGAFDELGNSYVYREFEMKDLVISAFARAITSLTPANEKIEMTFAPPDMWNRTKETGKSMAEIFYENGVTLTYSANGRVDGWLNLKEWLKNVPDGTGESHPRLRIFNTCNRLIHCLTNLQHDEKKVSDVAKEPHDITHLPDALRYLMDGRPRCAEAVTEQYLEEHTYENQESSFLGFGT